MSKTTNTFSPEVREPAIPFIEDHGHEHPSRSAAITLLASKIECTAQTFYEWLKKAEVDVGQRSNMPTEIPKRMKTLKFADHELRG